MAQVSRYLVATVRPTGNAGDQDDSTTISGTNANGGGVPAIITAATAAQALGNCGLGSRAIDSVEVFAKVTALVTGGALDDCFIVMKQGGNESRLAIACSGEWESAGVTEVDPGGTAWTGALLDSLELRIEADASLNPGGTVTVYCSEARVEAADFHRRLSGRAGTTFPERGRA